MSCEYFAVTYDANPARLLDDELHVAIDGVLNERNRIGKARRVHARPELARGVARESENKQPQCYRRDSHALYGSASVQIMIGAA
jgi:hypothetical protein